MIKIIAQRELRNGSVAVMDAVEDGETIRVTRKGSPVTTVSTYGFRCRMTRSSRWTISRS